MKLEQIARTLKFRIRDEQGSAIGSVCVSSPKEATELMRKFGGSVQRSKEAKPQSAVEMLASAFRAQHLGAKQRQAFVLRGC